MRLPKILLTAFFILLGVVILQVYLLKKWDSKLSLDNSPENTEYSELYNTVGNKDFRNSTFTLTGRFSSNIYTKDGVEMVDVKVGDDDIGLALAPEGWPIMVVLVNDVKKIPSTRNVEGKMKNELKNYVKKDIKFVSRIILPIRRESSSFVLEGFEYPDEERDYFTRNWDSIKNFVLSYESTGKLEGEIGLVSELVIEK